MLIRNFQTLLPGTGMMIRSVSGHDIYKQDVAGVISASSACTHNPMNLGGHGHQKASLAFLRSLKSVLGEL